MDSAKVIPFPRRAPPSVPDNMEFWVKAAFEMLSRNIDTGRCRPDRLLLVYETGNEIHYLNLGFTPARLAEVTVEVCKNIEATAAESVPL